MKGLKFNQYPTLSRIGIRVACTKKEGDDDIRCRGEMQRQIRQGRLEVFATGTGIAKILSPLFHRDMTTIVHQERLKASVDNDKVCLGIFLGKVDIEAYVREVFYQEKLVYPA